MGNSFGTLFRITTWGESHGHGVGVVVDGCPAGIALSIDDIQVELDRRRPGQSHLVTPRKESDTIKIMSGVFDGQTTGTPISMMVVNGDANSKAYDHLKDVFRPSHADFTYQEKYGVRDYRGGGRSSARETIGRVAAGAIAKQFLKTQFGIDIVSFVEQVYTHKATIDYDAVTMADVEANIVRCPDASIVDDMIKEIENARKEGDSLGGILGFSAKGVPVGWGEPAFDKLKSDFAKAMMSIPATMGVEFGSGFASASMKGSAHNDAFYNDNGIIKTKTNFSGGMQGGISNGMPIHMRISFKPVATIFKEQDTVDVTGKEIKLQAKGRHDPCVLPRAVPIVEAMAALVLADHALRQNARTF